ncbi:GNAT family acetyltransferase [Streptococcus suis]|uniref:GNAT family acetyltransferase n=1 Tax=Streptococcus suis TaxID=1307 RepID=UPI000CF5C5E8|nr:GNAT family acetyltransferase [Streptococcus suis]MBS8085744.1 GNAT family acetyltransferase [Streptococcus suis]MDW8710376.1 GNAT family acetyltransferase [Streptococcus suis]HEL1634284.1 GNAT family acetyltransferase [Streptococcus suis]HEM3526868.1 GNAT family acetyltransferase [Streptococcus suis]HEM5004681.1 GNAT family acetyltransferase [Streptococcus suis]
MLDISYQANTFHISHHGRPLGKIHSYQNPYHQTNIYLRLDLVDYDCTIAEQLFQSLQTFLEGKPLQVMLSSAEQERIHFLTAAGFVCKRKCYEFEVSKQDYLSQTGTSNLSIVRKGTAPYQIACQQIFNHYQTAHQDINPWTASQEEFEKDLPDLVYTDSENCAFVENNEIAYVCGKDEQSFGSFIQAVICQLFEQYEQISFEADDCDSIAMRLANQFQFSDKPSWDTYILDR